MRCKVGTKSEKRNAISILNLPIALLSLSVLVQFSHSSPLFDDISNALSFVTSLAPEMARMTPDMASFAPDLLQQVISTGGGTGGLTLADITAVDPPIPQITPGIGPIAVTPLPAPIITTSVPPMMANMAPGIAIGILGNSLIIGNPSKKLNCSS